MDVRIGPARRRAAGGLVALAGALVGAAIVGRLYERPGGLAVLAELNSPLLLGSLAVLALLVAGFLASRRPAVRKALGAALVAVAVLGVPAVPVLHLARDPFPSLQYDVPAPDGSPRRLVVERTSPLVDSVWQVYVDQGRFPAARRWPVTQYRDDDWSKGILGAQWANPDTIRLIDLDHMVHEIPVSAEGRPLAPMDW
ncbi:MULTISPECIES: hypothetical protein [unclassified Streptomyces]|uniref:hypothetical protein n=1 Tax=unclassified Streptomyces TaxID=2593676 RepID=UPI001BEA6146|nr:MULTISPECIES: hypothetical protein [unclassified Streptomyces]MBT2405737.1 hypothetical protein [Streptomyces sp. ISL-21]MBT2610367.1 hypothetical protein [Streptomyces sp. ISL-87]